MPSRMFGRAVGGLSLLLAVALLSGCKEELHRDLVESEANEIVAVLRHANIATSRDDQKVGGFTVSVEESQFADAVTLLNSVGLPRPKYATMVDVFKGDGLVPSPTGEFARYGYALEQSLDAAISHIDGVLNADVKLGLPPTDSLRRDPTPPSAAVFIRHVPGSRVVDLVPQIKMMVANAVPGLGYDKVSIAVVAAPPLPVSTTSDAMVPVLGLWLHRDSVRAFEIILVCGGALVAVLGGMLGWFMWRGMPRLRLGTSLVRR